MTKSFSVITGGRDGQDRIAMSIVHPRERIDVALDEVLAIEAVAEHTFAVSDGTTMTVAAPHVQVTLAPNIGARLYRLTSHIIDEAADYVVGGEIVCSPIVREPIGLRGTFFISASSLAEAEALAAKLRQGWVRPQLRVV
ncbi:hypothetical protein RPB_1949 [Rhodopseudomonas palustris HaA2]|uniref:Uncharacterized protein n=1 Tax=Rhodopseudomonas palustris (strain HaA2) TaxID=316058 RepID=Q2IYQ3_RHOP2|nr:hypothetical protein [Rhodopseudomonas palustris]ABD06657.1 hypothetical protein RPB_1949 [Rhodopseudomonas palustris HaA2]